jgi:uncharacterized protein YndB with AHSA1/START domain
MKVLKTLLFALVLLLAGLFLGGMLISSKFSVQRSTEIKATPDKLYSLIADPRAWKGWSVWNQRDPAMSITYSGPASGVGAVWEWKSKSQGDGKMTFTKAEPGKQLNFDLYFPDFGTTSQGELKLEALPAGGTRVVWTMNGDMGSNPLFHWLAMFGDKMVGPDFEAGLANLKALAEKP